MTESRRQALGRIESLIGTHIPVLDGWRGLAILLVIFHNASYVVDRDGSLASSLYHTAGETGWVGVSVFFVLSGFLITGILLDSLGKKRYFRDFYVRRTLRIFPLYYATLLVAFLVVPVFLTGSEWVGSVDRDQWWFWLYISNWMLPTDTGINGFGHFWSLAVEEQFYLIWPALLFLTGRRVFPWIAGLVVVAAPAIRWWLLSEGFPPAAAYGFTIARMDGLAVGALLAIAVRSPRTLALLYRVNIPAVATLTVALALIVVSISGLPPRAPLALIAGQSVVSLLTATLMLATLGEERRPERLLSHALSGRWLLVLGKYSYAIYIFHMFIHVALWDSARDFIEGTPVAWHTPLAIGYAGLLLLLSLAAARASWVLLERPSLGLKDVLAPRESAPEAS